MEGDKSDFKKLLEHSHKKIFSNSTPQSKNKTEAQGKAKAVTRFKAFQ